MLTVVGRHDNGAIASTSSKAPLAQPIAPSEPMAMRPSRIDSSGPSVPRS